MPRWAWLIGGCAASALALVFLLVGDGTGARGAGTTVHAPLHRLHGTVWLFLAAALLLAGVQGGWHDTSAGLAAVGGILYLVHLVLLLRTPRP